MFPWQSIGSELPPPDSVLFVDPALTTLPPTVHDATQRPDEAAAALTILAPGGESVSTLLALVPGRLSDTGVIDALIATDRQIAALQARQQHLLAETAKRDPDGEQYLREDVACALRLAPVTTGLKVETAVQLTGRLWNTLELVETGVLSYGHARILADAVKGLDDPITAKVQKRVLRRAGEQTPGEFKTAVRRAVAAYNTRDEGERHQKAFSNRQVRCLPEPDGMASIWMHLAADGADAVMTAINAHPGVHTPETGDQRTIDQRRADAAVEIALATLHDPHLPKNHGMRPTVQVTIPFDTLIGAGDTPGELDGYGPIPADMARRLAADPSGTWYRLITDPAGRMLDHPIRQYQPPAWLARHVTTRDQHCVHPGCRRKARTCHLDHRIPYPHGATDTHNLQPLCRRHHQMKHHSTWIVTKRGNEGPPDNEGVAVEGDTYHWISPTKHHYRYRPPELPTPVREDPTPIDHTPPPF